MQEQSAIKHNTFRVVLSGLFASILEWYDFSIYIFLTPVIAKVFFPHESHYVSMMLAYTVFALGYLTRPLGAVIFGHYGDRIGRQKTLTLSMKLMSFSTVLVGFLPTYAAIGILAPILLLLLRMIQGLSTAGGVIAAVTFAFESSPQRHRGLVTTIVWVFSGLGILLSTLLVAFLSGRLNTQQMSEWGWRIPFILGLISIVVSYIIPRATRESVYFSAMVNRGEVVRFPLVTLLKEYKAPFFRIFLIFIPSAINYYMFFVFLPTYSTHLLGHSLSSAMFTNALTMSFIFVFTPVLAFFSDKIGRKPFLIFGLLAYFFSSIIFFKLVSTGELRNVFIAQSLFAIIHSIYACSVFSASMEMLPTRIRFSALGLAYNLSYAIFGGTAPLMAAFLIHANKNVLVPAYYIMAFVVITLIGVLGMRETYKSVVL